MVKNKTQTQNLAETIFKSICPNHKCGLFNIIKYENTILEFLYISSTDHYKLLHINVIF